MDYVTYYKDIKKKKGIKKHQTSISEDFFSWWCRKNSLYFHYKSLQGYKSSINIWSFMKMDSQSSVEASFSKKFCSQWFIKYKQICFSGTYSQGLDSGFWILGFFSPSLFFTAHYFLWVTEMWEMFDCRMEKFLVDFFFNVTAVSSSILLSVF